MKVAIFPGSFDPFTIGHADVVKRASRIFDKVVVCVMQNSSKTPFFTLEQKIEIIKLSTKSLDNVLVDSHEGLLVNYAKKYENATLIKGLRSYVDFDYETSMANVNFKLAGDLDTVFLISKDEHRSISSSVIRELITLDGDYSHLVYDEIYTYIKSLEEK